MECECSANAAMISLESSVFHNTFWFIEMRLIDSEFSKMFSCFFLCLRNGFILKWMYVTNLGITLSLGIGWWWQQQHMSIICICALSGEMVCACVCRANLNFVSNGLNTKIFIEYFKSLSIWELLPPKFYGHLKYFSVRKLKALLPKLEFLWLLNCF